MHVYASQKKYAVASFCNHVYTQLFCYCTNSSFQMCTYADVYVLHVCMRFGGINGGALSLNVFE